MELTKIGGKCLGYDEWRKEIDDRVPKGNRSVDLRLKHAFSLIHLAHYHPVPVLDDNGRPKKYEKGDHAGEVITDQVECEGRKCTMCQEGLDKVFGDRRHWSLGSGHLEQFGGFASEIQKDCAGCGKGRLETFSWECAECAHVVVNMETTKLDQNEVDRITAAPFKCPKCEHTDYLLEQVECNNCQDPEPLSIFDCDLEIKRQGEGTNSTIQIPRWTPTELSKELKEMAKPYDFPAIFGGDPLDIQAKLLKIKNPYTDGDASRHAEDYGKDPDYEE